MPRVVSVLTCAAALQLTCAPANPTARVTASAPAYAEASARCESKAETDAQAAHACLAGKPADAPISAERARPFLGGVCQFGERHGRVGCAGCAPELAVSSARPEAFAEVLHVLEGSFTGPDRSEALLTFAACEPEATGSSMSLLRRERGQFRLAEALPPSVAGRCTPSPRTRGYSLLACTGGASDGTGASWLDVIDLHLRRRLRLFSVSDTLRAACADGKRSRLRSFGAVDLAFRDLDGDGVDDLWVRALWAAGAEPAGYDANCRDLLSPPEDWQEAAAALRSLSCELPDHRCSELEFLAKGDSFEPSVATARVLAEVEARSPAAPSHW